jgi:hypothetical protein
MSDPAESKPMACCACGHKWDEAKREPQREWRLNDAGEGVWRLVEVVDGKLVAVGLQAKADDWEAAHGVFAEVLKGMAAGLEKPVVKFRQIMEEVEQ